MKVKRMCTIDNTVQKLRVYNTFSWQWGGTKSHVSEGSEPC